MFPASGSGLFRAHVWVFARFSKWLPTTTILAIYPLPQTAKKNGGKRLNVRLKQANVPTKEGNLAEFGVD
ncbi:MAG: hypothetical protein PHU46_03150 [Rhodocyclaceae bacterium]|nr:hypothetical protein [Rhodocyclaceae bacterium]